MPAPPPRRGVHARLRVELRAPDGRVLDARDRPNTVLQEGARLLADLFRGAAGPINRMAVGVAADPEVPPYATVALARSGPSGELTGEAEVSVDPGAFEVVTDTDALEVRVQARVALPGGADGLAGPVAEAALLHLAQDGTRRLYNRVTFEPIDKQADQELALWWEVRFPFGDLTGSTESP